MGKLETCDVIIIGAGPSGAVAAGLLARNGFDVRVLEREHFPRFSIGESLLPQCMTFLEDAGMLDAVENARFQHKSGAAFRHGDENYVFEFSDKSAEGWATTYQVKRAPFDKLLADRASQFGARIDFGHEITDVDISQSRPKVFYKNEAGQSFQLEGRFCLDASGFGRVLTRLLDLGRPSDFPMRQSVFAHIEDNIDDARFDREKILITVHEKMPDVWYWLIPFSDGSSSIGVVGEANLLAKYKGDNEEILRVLIGEDRFLHSILSKSKYKQPVRSLAGYSSSVSTLYGKNFALLGNAGEFLDPIFSSGVTIALKSAVLASNLIQRMLRGEAVDWEEEFSRELQIGVDCFRHFVTAWYDGRLQDIIFTRSADPRTRKMICSILAGYAWDRENFFVTRTDKRLTALAEICRNM